MSTMDRTRVRKPAGERWRPGHRRDEPVTRAGGAGVLLHAGSGEPGETARGILAAAAHGEPRSRLSATSSSSWPVTASAKLVPKRSGGLLRRRD